MNAVAPFRPRARPAHGGTGRQCWRIKGGRGLSEGGGGGRRAAKAENRKTCALVPESGANRHKSGQRRLQCVFPKFNVDEVPCTKDTVAALILAAPEAKLPGPPTARASSAEPNPNTVPGLFESAT